MTESDQGFVEPAPQDFKDLANSLLPSGGESPQPGTTDEHCPGPQSKRLRDVPTPTDPTVEENLDLIADRVNDPGQGAKRAGRRPERKCSEERLQPLDVRLYESGRTLGAWCRARPRRKSLLPLSARFSLPTGGPMCPVTTNGPAGSRMSPLEIPGGGPAATRSCRPS